MGILENLLMKDKINGTEKSVIFLELIKREMDLLNEYCKNNGKFPKEYRIEFCHLHNIKKVNIDRLLSILKYHDSKFIEILMFTDPKVRRL